MKTPQWQGKADVFPSLIAIVLGNAYLLTISFIWRFPKTEIRSCFFSPKLI
jgi:hypothetical protein